MYPDEFFGGTVFRVASPALENPPATEQQAVPENWTARVIEYFNTNQEVYIFVPPDAKLQAGELYRLGEEYSTATNRDDATGSDLLDIRYRPLDVEDFQFELEEGDQYEFGDGGGEGAVRPRNFYTNTLFRVTSGPQGWVPDDVAQSGWFTDYNTVHAQYLGTNDSFLFFPQEDPQVEEGGVYVLWEEFEFLDPAGNLVAVEFNQVDEQSITVSEEFL